MTGTKITNTRSTGVKITQPNQNPVLVTAHGTIVTNGDYAIYDATGTPGRITNHGLLESTSATGTGVEELAAKSRLVNFGTISGGGAGVYMVGGGAMIANSGTITATAAKGDAILLANGGGIENDGILSSRGGDGIKVGGGNATIANDGAGAAIAGALYGVLMNANGSIGNEGSITGATGAGIYIAGRGTIVNGDAMHETGLIGGGSYGVFAGGAASLVSNFGTIIATVNSGIGVALNDGGTLRNGSAAAPGAAIHGGLDGVLVRADGARIANYGTITGGDGIGVKIESGKETVINGNGKLANYLIAGNTYGVSLGGDGIVRNDGTITAISGAGVYIAAAGTISNGAMHEKSMISGGRYGAYIGGVGTVTNFGTIAGANSASMGVELNHGGTLRNGSASDISASVLGGTNGVLVDSGSLMLTNDGTISGTGRYGIFIENNDGTNSIVNNAGAVIEGVTGLEFGGAGTLANAGTITGTGGDAVIFTGMHDTLLVDPGAAFNGTVDGGGTANTLEFAAGTGAIGRIGTDFTHFGTVQFDAGAAWSLSGGNSAASLLNNGTVTIAAAATLDVTAAIDAGSTGIFQLASGATLEVAADLGARNRMNFLGQSELIIDNGSQFGTHAGTTAYTGPELENFTEGDMIDLRNIASAGASLTYTSATGLLQIASSGSAVATLYFENSSLGSGSFHLGHDSAGHALVTHH